MAALLAVFAAFEREILGERCELDWLMPGRTASALADPQPQYSTPIKSAKLRRSGLSNPRSPAPANRTHLRAPYPG